MICSINEINFDKSFAIWEKSCNFATRLRDRKIVNNSIIKMYAIVEIAGKQFKVVQDQKIFVNRLQNEEGSQVSFDTVMLKDNEGAVEIGQPYVAGSKVTVTVLKHLKGDKVLVFHKKRRKGYQKMNGHRDYLTQIKIDSIQ